MFPKNLRIVVFIDDLDRCLPEKAIELLEGIKTFLDIPGYIFFIGVDRAVIEKGVKVKYKGYVVADKAKGEQADVKTEAQDMSAEIPITPSDYLEKIVQLPITLPPIDKSRVEGYLLTLLDQNKALKPYLDIIQLGLRQNPRTYKRFINTLVFHTKLAVEKGCLMSTAGNGSKTDETGTVLNAGTPQMTLELLVKWTIINFAFSGLVNEMQKSNRKLLIVDIQEWIERLDNEKKGADALAREGKGQAALDAPPYVRVWLEDEKLVTILRKKSERGDSGFSRDNIDLYIQMGEFTSRNVTIIADPLVTNISVKGEFHTSETGKMVRIPKGNFIYGDSKTEKEIPYDYEIDSFPVTNAQYKKFIDEEKEHEVPYHEADWAKGYNWNKEERTFPEGKENHPVVFVSYKDAEEYCRWLSRKEEKEIRLPTEEEWEKAARGTDGRKYPWGDEFDKNKCNTAESKIGATTPVDKYPDGVSYFGCYDMAGNVWEWTSSDYDSSSKVLRGGSWDDFQGYARCAFRLRANPDNRLNSLGFRCARTPK